jgi:hypothetical protein
VKGERERLLGPVAVRCAVLAGVTLLAAVPGYVFAEPAWRPVVARLAAALVLGVGLVQLRGVVAERLARGGGSALERARDRAPAPPAVPIRFQELIAEVRAARRSRRHFERTLWPRLVALARRPLVALRSRPGRGPSLGALRDAVAEIERQR